MRSLLGTFLLLLIASATSAANFTLSGKVLDSAGNPRYAFVDVYRSGDKVVAGGAYSGRGDDMVTDYSVSLPAGTYDVYVRIFGYLPVEVRDIVVQGDVVRNLNVDTTAGTATPAYLKSAATSTPVVFAGVPASSTAVSITATQDLGPTLSLFNEFGNFTVDGVPYGTFPLYDDGTHGDAAAGDRVYTRGGVGFREGTMSRCNTMGVALLLFGRTASGAIVRVPDVRVIGVSASLAAPPAVPLPNGAQATPYAANIIADTSKSGWEAVAAREFYKTFADAYDFLFIFPDTPYGAAGRTIQVRNTITGLGLALLDDSSQYGGPRALQAFAAINFDAEPPLLHEFLHRWGNGFHPTFDATYISHWGYSSVNGQLGGFDPAQLVKNADGSYTINGSSLAPIGTRSDLGRYAPLELYMAGFLPASQVPATTIFTGVQTIGGNADHFTGTRADVTINDLIARYGPRNPSLDSSQKRFRVAFVGATRQPLSAAGMTYLTILAQQFSGRSCTRSSFPLATNGIAVVDPSIVVKGGVRRRAVR
jgi:hypothetical protein